MGSSWRKGQGWVQVGGQCLGRGQGLGSRLGYRSGVKVVGKVQGHDRWSQGPRSRSVVKVRV